MPSRRMFAMSVPFLFLAVNLSAAHAQLPPPTASIDPIGDCGQQTGGAFDYKYCIYRTAGSQSTDVLWFLHGRGGDEHSWDSDSHFQIMRSTWTTQDPTNIPTVIAVSFGTQWLLTTKLTKPASGMLDFFESSVIPTMEKKVGFTSGRRLLFGESMGGFGAAQLVLSGAVHFDRAVLACPALAWLSPYASTADIATWAEQNGVNLFIALSVVATARTDFASTSEWETASPMYLAANHLGPQTPPLFISIGQQDTFGFYLGARDFMNIAKAKSGNAVEWQPVPGPHCSFDEAASAKFVLATE